MTAPILVAAAHGTKDAGGLAELEKLAELVRAAAPGVTVELCYVDVAEPSLVDTLSRISSRAVVVPLLLATGYHVKTDIPVAVDGNPLVAVSDPIGPDPRISRAMFERLEQARAEFAGSAAAAGVVVGPAAGIVVAAAGSSDPEARLQLAEVAGHLREWTDAEVSYLQLTEPEPWSGVQEPFEVANYLLAPGFFNTKLARSAAGQVVGAPIGAHRLVAEVILDRYHLGCAALDQRMGSEPARRSL
ncbi:hypothetical protein BH10ACT8_BH10ACT8_27250 [soil metagenome]